MTGRDLTDEAKSVVDCTVYRVIMPALTLLLLGSIALGGYINSIARRLTSPPAYEAAYDRVQQLQQNGKQIIPELVSATRKLQSTTAESVDARREAARAKYQLENGADDAENVEADLSTVTDTLQTKSFHEKVLSRLADEDDGFTTRTDDLFKGIRLSNRWLDIKDRLKRVEKSVAAMEGE